MNLKKNLVDIIKVNPQKCLYFFDEARFGTRSNTGYGWFEHGTRTQVKVSQGFGNFYVYSSIEVATGIDHSLCFPLVNTDCMNMYLKDLSLTLGEKEAILVMDCAGWHKSKNLRIPENILIVYLPPYSPELNPVEKFWQYIKSRLIKNRIYKSLATLENAVSDFITNLDSKTIKITCSINHVLS